MVELKFVPLLYPTWESDLRKLVNVFRPGAQFTVSDLDPDTGKCGRTYVATFDTISIYAAIGRHDAKAVSRDDVASGFARVAPESASVTSRILHASGALDPATKKSRWDVQWLDGGDISR